MDGSGGFRWFFCPVIEDPRDGAIAPDAHLDVTDGPAAEEFIRLFTCLRRSGDACDHDTCTADWNDSGAASSADIAAFLTSWLASVNAGHLVADFNHDLATNSADISAFLGAWL